MKQNSGYTVIEVLMFMAVSLLLFVSAVTAVVGRQAQVQFTQGVNDFNSQLQDIINDVNTGFFPHNNNFRCNAPTGSGQIFFSSAADQQGTSENCIFFGKALQFEPAGRPGTARLITIAGKRMLNGALTSSVTTATPRAVTGPPPEADITQTITLKNGIYVTDVSEVNPVFRVGAVAFLSNFATAPGEPGSSSTKFTRLANTSLNASINSVPGVINNLNDSRVNLNPPEGLVICLRERGGNRRASITIGGDGRGPVTTVDFDNYNTAICTS